MRKFILILISIIITSSCISESRIDTVHTVKVSTKNDYIKLTLEDGSGIPLAIRVIDFTYKEHNYIMFGQNEGRVIIHNPDCPCMQQYIPEKKASIWNY